MPEYVVTASVNISSPHRTIHVVRPSFNKDFTGALLVVQL